MNERLDLELPAEPSSVRAARTCLMELSDSLAEETLWRAKLVVSELVTNVVRHGRLEGGAQVQVHVRMSPSRLRTEVCNSAPPLDVRAGLPPDVVRSSGGLGLYLVDQVADRWGVQGSCVWAEIDFGR